MRYLAIALLLIASTVFADINCDGIDDSITVSTALSAFMSATDGTMMSWTKVATSPTFSGNGSCYPAVTMIRDSGGMVASGRRDESRYCTMGFDTAVVNINSTATAGWHHITWRHTGGNLGVYIDGVAGSTSALGTLPGLTGTLAFCTGLADRIADIRIYNTALAVDEIAMIAQSRIRRLGRTQPTGYWPLTDCADGASGVGTTFSDSSGNNSNATGNGGANSTGVTCRASEWLSLPWGPSE